MLITCPECSHNVSDKAFACPQCGFPIMVSSKPLSENPNKKTRGRKKHKKLPNGFGSIQKLSGNRTHPYAAYPAANEYSLSGSPKKREVIGYYKTWYIAYDALSEYNRLSEQEQSELLHKRNIRSFTFDEIYDMYYKDKFKKELAAGGKKTSMMYSVASAYKNSSVLHKKVFSQLRKNDFQKVIDDCPLKYASKELLVMLFGQMSKFSLENDYIDKNYAQYAAIDSDDDDENGVPFTPNELDILWKDSADPVTQMILIMIYTGFRISAFEDIQINKKEKYFNGGVKTKSSKKRIVPIHSLIQDFLDNMFLQDFCAYDFRNKYFYPKLEQLCISISSEQTKHTPHDCRHTFSWLCDKYKIDEITKHMLMGHALKGDVEVKKYSHRTFAELKESIEKIRK